MIKRASQPDTTSLAFPRVEETVLALGLGLLILMRPWFDGMTFPEYNVPFTWACAALASAWGAMVLSGRAQVRFATPVVLLALFVLVAVLTAPFTTQYNATYRNLINWSGYLLLFIVAANGLRSPVAIGFVIACFAISSVAEIVYGVLHVNYIMPRTREMIARDPALIPRFFGIQGMTADLSARLESNRASGSLLFANALACWVLTGIPLAIAATNGIYLRLRDAHAAPKPVSGPRNEAEQWRMFFAAIAVGLLTFVAVTFYYTVYFIFAYGDTADWNDYMVRWATYCIVVPLAVTAAAFWYARKHGVNAMWLAALLVASGITGIISVYGLGATYSRGGMLAVALALGVLVLLMFQRKATIVAKNTAIGMALGLALLAPLAIESHAQQTEQRATVQQSQAPQQEQLGPLSLQGVNPSWQAMTDPNTAMLRFGYWMSGVRMLAAHPFTGVGLGNFGTVYPQYQFLGAGDVKPAHNDYLQAACETGTFGLIAFLAFWGAFALTNARAILRESDRAARWFRAGVFAGVMGFLFHSFVDFNFFNPSLAALAFLFAGLTYALQPDTSPASKRVAQSFVVAVFALSLWTVYAGYRVNHIDSVIGREVSQRVRLEAADLLLDDTNKTRDPNKPFGMYDATVAILIEDRATRESIGRIFVPSKPGATGGRYLGQGEEIPQGAYLIMPDLVAARNVALAAIPKWIERCVNADRVFPHDPDASAHIVQWWDKLREFAPTREEKIKAADESIRWSEESIRRSPHQTAYYDALGKTLWSRAVLESSPKQYEYFDRAIDAFKKCPEIYPIKSQVWRDYGGTCLEYAAILKMNGKNAEADARTAEGNAALKQAAELDEKLAALARR